MESIGIKSNGILGKEDQKKAKIPPLNLEERKKRKKHELLRIKDPKTTKTAI